MKHEIRDVFILASVIAVWGVVLWVMDKSSSSAWAESFKIEPRALFARDHNRDRMMAEEFTDIESLVSEVIGNATD